MSLGPSGLKDRVSCIEFRRSGDVCVCVCSTKTLFE